ncbi:MAG: ABC transporter permease [Desertimonas sp.]
MSFLDRNLGALSALAGIVVLIVGGFAGLPMLWLFLVSFALVVIGATMVNGTQVLRRLALVVPTVLVVTAFTFYLQNSRGDTRDLAFNILGPGATDAGVDRIVKEFHLDEPMHTRFILWLSDALRGDLGNSPIRSGQSVSDAIAKALPVTLQLMLYTQIVALLIAIPLGVYASYRANKLGDKVASMTSLAFLSIPNFVLASVLVLMLALGGFTINGFQIGWGVFPASRYQPFGGPQGMWEHFKYMFLPTMSLALGQSAAYMRVLRSDMISTLQENFITTAKAKGVPNRRILWRHALRPSSFTLMTVFGLNTATLIGGALIIELIFNLPGLGTTIGTAIAQKDFLVVQGVVVVIAVGFVLINFLVDALYGVLDPRVRHVRA